MSDAPNRISKTSVGTMPDRNFKLIKLLLFVSVTKARIYPVLKQSKYANNIHANILKLKNCY